MKPLKTITFFTLAPFFAILIGLNHLVYGDGKEGNGFFQTVWSSGNKLKIALAVLMAPISFSVAYTLRFAVPIWEGLIE